MKILLLGAQGQVGWEALPLLSNVGETVGLARADLDLSDLDAVGSALRAHRPDVVVNAAAYNEVDRAESDAAAAFRLNAELPEALGRYARETGGFVVHYSTDFVFDGKADRPYVETDPTNPLSAYARSKLAGEQAVTGLPVVVLRTAWVYSLRRKSFVSMVLRLAREREELALVTNQVGSPTYCHDLAVATVGVVERVSRDRSIERVRGVYHAAGGGSVSRADFALAALELDPARSEQKVKSIKRVTADAFPAPAERPQYAPLSSAKLAETFGLVMPPWRDALARAFSRGV
ncbi:MAG TPA: dTDP-4-dehydrorhamnose reductase [Polyangiaceae bacterium]|nr:dTDP-4-dehydrorhamnose reductase [Polyangiaceae bacterium]